MFVVDELIGDLFGLVELVPSVNYVFSVGIYCALSIKRIIRVSAGHLTRLQCKLALFRYLFNILRQLQPGPGKRRKIVTTKCD